MTARGAVSAALASAGILLAGWQAGAQVAEIRSSVAATSAGTSGTGTSGAGSASTGSSGSAGPAEASEEEASGASGAAAAAGGTYAGAVVQTRFATSTLALLRAHLGEDLEPVAEQARAALRAEPAAALRTAEQISFLGRGWTIGLAAEAALKLRESAQLWTESYPAMEYRHGPISIAAPGRVTWALGSVPAGLAEQVRATGAHFEHATVDPLAELVRVHQLCLLAAAARGLDPDRPRHLSRSIILTP